MAMPTNNLSDWLQESQNRLNISLLPPKKKFRAKCSLDRQNTWPLWLRMIRISIYLIKVAQKSPLLKVD